MSEKNKFAEHIFAGKEAAGGSSSFIVHGSKFEYRIINNIEYLTSRGPLLKPLVVSLEGDENTESDISLEYVIEAKEETLSSRSRYQNNITKKSFTNDILQLKDLRESKL